MDLAARYDASSDRSEHYSRSLETLRILGARAALLEDAYIDRDFSVAHSKFYATLFQPSTKYCQRVHFFAQDLPEDLLERSAKDRAKLITDQQPHYLGFLVLRPLPHAPVSWGVLSAKHAANNPKVRVPVRGVYWCHVQGAELYVEGAPCTEQDGRVGACAQAAAWTIARHTHVRHRGSWYSVSAITELALTSVDHWISRGLPAGSGALSLDGMLRALRTMERHPLVIGPNPDPRSPTPGPNGTPNLVWNSPPAEVIWQYLDSQIPVIVGLRRGAGIGHAVVAVGVQQGDKLDCTDSVDPTFALGVEHFLVQDDQSGPYQPMHLKLQRDASGRPEPNAPWSLEDCQYLVVPMPDKVFLTGEDAEALARDLLAEMIADRERLLEGVSGDASAPLDQDLVNAVVGGRIVARTYLSHGWSYQKRAIYNNLPASLKEEVSQVQFPRFVWVTEFFLPSACQSNQLSDEAVVAHIVVDATGSPFWDSYLVADIPGLAIVWSFEARSPLTTAAAVFLRTNRTTGYAPKRGGTVT
jgi:hypothetical protein